MQSLKLVDKEDLLNVKFLRLFRSIGSDKLNSGGKSKTLSSKSKSTETQDYSIMDLLSQKKDFIDH